MDQSGVTAMLTEAARGATNGVVPPAVKAAAPWKVASIMVVSFIGLSGRMELHGQVRAHKKL